MHYTSGKGFPIIMGRHLPPGWPHTSTISMHFLKGGGPPPQTVLLFCALSRRVLMIFWWYFDDILFRFTCQKLPPPADVLLFDPFFWSKTEEIALKCTIPQEKAFPYGRSQKLTPPQNVLLFDAFFLKEYTENALKSQNRILTWTFT